MNSQNQQQQSRGDHGEHSSRDDSPREQSEESSATPSRPGSTEPRESRRRERPRVKFTTGGESLDHLNQRSTFDIRDTSQSPSDAAKSRPLSRTRRGPLHSWSPHDGGLSSSPRQLNTDGSTDITESFSLASVSERRPSIFNHRSNSSGEYHLAEDRGYGDGEDAAEGKTFSQVSAQERAQKLARVVGTHSAPGSKRQSPSMSPVGSSSPPMPFPGYPAQSNDIPLVKLKGRNDESTDEDTDNDNGGPSRRRKRSNTSEAHRLVRAHTKREPGRLFRVRAPSPGQRSGQVTPVGDRDPDEYVPPPRHYRGGILSSLLKLYDEQGLGQAMGDGPSGSGGPSRRHRRGSSVETVSRAGTPGGTPHGSPPSSGTNTPKPKNPKWYKSPNHSTSSLSGLISSSTVLAQPGSAHAAPKVKRPHPPGRPRSTNALGAAINRISKPRLEDEIRITVHIAETLSRQRFLVKLCRALMQYGAPTHRLEGSL